LRITHHFRTVAIVTDMVDVEKIRQQITEVLRNYVD